MGHDSISDVVVMHGHGSMCMLLRMALTDDGYTVSEVPSYTMLLRHLRTAAKPVVVVAGNWTADYRAEMEFFRHIATDMSLAGRHRYVLLCTVPEWLPEALDSLLHGLGVPVLHIPSHLPELLDTVAAAAGRGQAEDESVS